MAPERTNHPDRGSRVGAALEYIAGVLLGTLICAAIVGVAHPYVWVELGTAAGAGLLVTMATLAVVAFVVSERRRGRQSRPVQRTQPDDRSGQSGDVQ